jgi:hypothetical protein
MEEKKGADRENFNRIMATIQERISQEQKKHQVLGMMVTLGTDQENLKLTERWINAFLANGLTVQQAMAVLNSLARLGAEDGNKKP